jgi:hypothetical protein
MNPNPIFFMFLYFSYLMNQKPVCTWMGPGLGPRRHVCDLAEVSYIKLRIFKFIKSTYFISFILVTNFFFVHTLLHPLVRASPAVSPKRHLRYIKQEMDKNSFQSRPTKLNSASFVSGDAGHKTTSGHMHAAPSPHMLFSFTTLFLTSFSHMEWSPLLKCISGRCLRDTAGKGLFFFYRFLVSFCPTLSPNVLKSSGRTFFEGRDWKMLLDANTSFGIF